MTAVARRLQSTPMAPYINVMSSMDVNDMHLVVEFLNEAIRKREMAKRKPEDEFLAKKMSEISIDPNVKKLFSALRLTTSETADERTRWILGSDRK